MFYIIFRIVINTILKILTVSICLIMMFLVSILKFITKLHQLINYEKEQVEYVQKTEDVEEVSTDYRKIWESLSELQMER